MEIASALETLGPDAAPARRVGIGHKTGPIFITVGPQHHGTHLYVMDPQGKFVRGLELAPFGSSETAS